MAEGLSIRAYAAHRKERGLRGATPQSVSKALKAKRIVKNADGKIDPDVADAMWASKTDPTKGQDLRESAKVPSRGNVQPVQPGRSVGCTSDTEDEEPLDLAQERARLAKVQADLKEVELELLEGNIIKADEARDIMVSMVTSAKERLLGLGAELAPELCGLAGGDSAHAAAVADRIDVAVNEALSELRNDAFGGK